MRRGISNTPSANRAGLPSLRHEREHGAHVGHKPQVPVQIDLPPVQGTDGHIDIAPDDQSDPEDGQPPQLRGRQGTAPALREHQGDNQDGKLTGEVGVQRTASVGQILLKVSDTFSAARARATETQRMAHSIRHKRRTSTANDHASAAVVNPTTIALSGAWTKGASPTLNPTM